MSQRYSIAEARKSLSRLVTDAEAGFEVQFTRRGKPVAVLLSIHEYERFRERRKDFRAAYARFLDEFELEEVGLEEGFASSLRDPSGGRPVDL